MNKWYDNDDVMRDVQTVLFLLFFLLSPFAVMIISSNFSIDKYLNIEIGVLGVYGIINSNIIIMDIKNRALDSVVRTYAPLKKSIEDIITEQNKITDTQHAIDIIHNESDIERNIANDKVKKNALTKLDIKIKKQLIKGRSIKRLTRKKDNIIKYGLVSKKFREINPENILSLPTYSKKIDLLGDKKYYDDPKQESIIVKLLLIPLKFISFGGALLGGIVLGYSVEVIVFFYVALLLSTLVLSVWKWYKIRKRAKTKTLAANLQKHKLLVKINTAPNAPITYNKMVEAKDFD